MYMYDVHQIVAIQNYKVIESQMKQRSATLPSAKWR
jgi:hypothetical protein